MQETLASAEDLYHSTRNIIMDTLGELVLLLCFAFSGSISLSLSLSVGTIQDFHG